MKHKITLFVLLITLPIGTALSAETQNEKAAERHELQAAFMKLCDLACDQLPLRKRPYYRDAYSVRALAVAYDITGKPKYLKACQNWADNMVRHQEGMNPSGAYYMNYGRKPGESTGDWYSADAACIAMGVLATSVRTVEPETRAKYMRSVRAFADLVIERYQRDGGFTDGIWEKYDGPWWCSTGTFGSLAFLLYNECGENKYLDAGLEAVDWLNGQNLEKTLPETFNIKAQGPAFIMYFFEAYSAGLQYILPNTERQKKTWGRIEEAMKWMQSRFDHPGGVVPVSHSSQWGSKIGGLPFHLYVWSRYRPKSIDCTDMADVELKYITSFIFDDERFPEGQNDLRQLRSFTMLSLAEKLSPGSVYRR